MNDTVKGSILVVDDSHDSLKLLTDVLESEGYDVRPADGGEIALASAMASPPDLILLDMLMPGMDGLEVFAHLREDPRTQGVPVIFATASPDIERRVEGLEMGAADYITKPFARSELLARVSAQIRLQQLRALADTQADELRVAAERLVIEKGGRLQSEQDAAERQLLLRAAIDNAPFGAHLYALEQDGRLVFIGYNRKAEEMLGIDHAELIGMTLEEAFPGNEGADTATAYRRIAREGGVWEKDQYAYDSRGITGVFEIHAFSIGPNRVSVFFRDITEKRKLELALDESEARLERATTDAPFPMMIHAEDGEVLMVNRAWMEITGYSQADLPTTADWTQKAYGERAELVQTDIEALYGMEHRREEGEYTVRTASGEERVWDFCSAPLGTNSDGRRLVLSTARDITDRKRDEVELEQRAAQLEMLAEERERNLEKLAQSLESVIEIVGQVVETRDPYTAGHERRVSDLAARISEELGMSAEQVEEIRIAAIIHDVGKMSVPAEILSKPGRLSEIEFELIKGHAESGYKILTSANMEPPVTEVVYQHHERCDGSGYPRGLSGDELLEGAKIIMVADVVEAMSSHRPYRAALGIELALAEIERGAGREYDSQVVDACLRIFREQDFVFSEI